MGSYFVDIDLDMEEPTIEVPPPSKKKKAGLGKRMSYKYPRARNFLADLATTHLVEEMRELFAVGVEFPDLGMIKGDAGHLVLCFDNFMARPEEQRLSS